MGDVRSIRFAAERTLLAGIRDFAVDAARSMGATVDLDILAVVVGELAANAVVHQDGEAELTVSLVGDGGVRISVCDADPTLPELVEGSAWDVNGHRGMQLIAGLVADWGVDRAAEGKEVWARLAPKS